MKLSTLPALAALAYFAGPAAAQPDPLVRPLPPAAAGTEVLGRLLQELGYTPKALSPDVYQVTVERDRWPVHVMLSLSTDGRRIWLESKFAPVEDPNKVPPLAWKRLLEANEKIGPAHFAFDRSDRRIHLYKSFDNQGLTAARLKAELEHFDTTVRKTQDYWRGDNFKPVIASTDPHADPTKLSGPPEKTAALPVRKGADLPALPVAREPRQTEGLEGEWSVTEIHAKGRKTPDEVLKGRRPVLAVNVLTRGFELPTGKTGISERVRAELRMGPGRSRTVDVKFPPAMAVPPPGSPRTGPVDFVDERDQVEQGIYKLEGDTLTLCFAPPGAARPVEFKTAAGSPHWLIVLKRGKK